MSSTQISGTPTRHHLGDVYAPDGQVVLMAGSEESLGGEQIPCAVVLDPDGTQRARTCDTAFLRFSPDGARLQGGSYENDSTARVTLLDTDLETLATIEPTRPTGSTGSTGPTVSQIAWESSRSLVAVERAQVGDRVSWSLVRYSVDDTDTPEVVAGPILGQEYPPVFRVSD